MKSFVRGIKSERGMSRCNRMRPVGGSPVRPVRFTLEKAQVGQGTACIVPESSCTWILNVCKTMAKTCNIAQKAR